MAQKNTKKNQKNTADDTKQIKITLSIDVYKKLQTASVYNDMTKSEYIEKTLNKKFKKIKSDTTMADMQKYMKV